MILKCTEKPLLMFNSLIDYIKDSKSEDSWNWKQIHYTLDQDMIK